MKFNWSFQTIPVMLKDLARLRPSRPQCRPQHMTESTGTAQGVYEAELAIAGLIYSTPGHDSFCASQPASTKVLLLVQNTVSS